MELLTAISPEKQQEVMDDYRVTLAATGDVHSIKLQVKTMLAMLEKHFPDQVEHAQVWMWTRAHFFGKIGLWGKFG